MSKLRYLCWNLEHFGDDEDPSEDEKTGAPTYGIFDAEDAAKWFAESTYSRNEYPEETRVGVLDTESGKKTFWVVRAEMEPQFYASEVEGPTP